MSKLRKTPYGSACLRSSLLGIFLCMSFPALGEKTNGKVISPPSECEIVKKKFLESENPTSADAEKFVDCFHVDITSGTASQIIDEDHPESNESCIKGTEDNALACHDS